MSKSKPTQRAKEAARRRQAEASEPPVKRPDPVVKWLHQPKGQPGDSYEGDLDEPLPDDQADEEELPASDEGWRPFPLECLPVTLSEYAKQAAACICVDPAMLAIGMLPVFAAMIGNSRLCQVNHEWPEVCVIWAMAICRASSKKTAVFKKVMTVADMIEDQLDAQNKVAAEEYERKLAEFEETVKADRKGNTFKPHPNSPAKPPERQFRILDATPESIVNLIEANPNGLLMARDELGGWLSAFGRYASNKGPGPEEAFWLEAHGAGRFIVNRKTGEKRKSSVRGANVSIYGSIQQRILKSYARENFFESGFASRFLWFQPPKVLAKWNTNKVDESVFANYKWLANQVYDTSLLLFESNLGRTLPIPYASKAKKRVGEWYDYFAKIQHESFGEVTYSLAKLEGYVGRLALVVATLEAAERKETLKEISLEHFEKAVRMKEWFVHETKRVVTMLKENPFEESRGNLVDWIRQQNGQVTPRLLTNMNKTRYPDVEAARVELQSLVDAKRGRWHKIPPGPKGGRWSEVFRLNAG